ncbi:Uncharacterised protein [Nocardia africana]|uniref:Uncharacterized protein n=1 Tax=Nocardia africana TaxID=134964 RepID=A0A378WVJ2_9NOCA|nr:Uncharacterised protein [Nocardia africana]
MTFLPTLLTRRRRTVPCRPYGADRYRIDPPGVTE